MPRKLHRSDTGFDITCTIRKPHKIQRIICKKLFLFPGEGLGAEGGVIPLALPLLIAMAWGLWWWPLRYLTTLGPDIVVINAGLMTFAAIGLAPLLLFRSLRQGIGHWSTLVSGALLGIALIFWNHALVEGTVLRCVVLFYLSPVWSMLVGRVFLGDAVAPGRLLPLVPAVCAAGLLVVGEGDAGMYFEMADLLALSAGFAFTLSGTAARMGPVTWYPRLLIACIAGALVVWPMVGAVPPVAQLAEAGGWIGLVALMAVLGVCLIFPAQLAAGSVISGRCLLAVLLAEIMTAAVSAALMADEPLGPLQWASLGLITLVAVLECRQSAVGQPADGNPSADRIPITPDDHH